MKKPLSSPSGDGIWEGVDRLVDRAPTLADLRSHGIELLAVRRWRAQGRTIPDELADLERTSALHRLVVPPLLERVRAAYDGPMIVHKGPEVAAHYPDPTSRYYGDVDLLVLDAEEAQRMLIAAGFEEIGDPAIYLGIHHLRPLRWPELPLHVEIHSRPKWLEALPRPSTEELFAAAVPSTATVDGFLALHVVDIAAVAEAAAEPAEIAALARAWGVSRLWRATDEAIYAALEGGQRPLSVRVWARNLMLVRERTVLENHLERWLSEAGEAEPGCVVDRGEEVEPARLPSRRGRAVSRDSVARAQDAPELLDVGACAFFCVSVGG